MSGQTKMLIYGFVLFVMAILASLAVLVGCEAPKMHAKEAPITPISQLNFQSPPTVDNATPFDTWKI